MKLTKNKLKEMIREELLNEKGGASLKHIQQLEDTWDNVLDDIATSNLTIDDRKYEQLINQATKVFNKALGILSKIH